MIKTILILILGIILGIFIGIVAGDIVLQKAIEFVGGLI